MFDQALKMLGNLAAWVTGALDHVFEYNPDEDLDFGENANGLIDLQCGRTVFNDVPSKMRTELWASQLHKQTRGSTAVAKYSSLASSQLPPDVVGEIEKDTHRTFPGHAWLRGRAGQLAMLRVLRAYAVYDPEVGYTQGMNFLAGLFLAYLDEPQAFGALVLVMQDRGLRALYLPNDGMALLQVRLWQLARLIPPRLSAHLENHAALPVLYASSWFLTCFSAEFSMHFAARVMDLVVTDCYAAPFMKVAVHILERCEQKLLQMEDLEEMIDYLRKDVPKWPQGTLQDLLTEALGRGWTARQNEVLKEINGAESVAEAVARVDLALAAAGGAIGDDDDKKSIKEIASKNIAENTKAGASGSPNVTNDGALSREHIIPSTPQATFKLPPPPTSRNDKVEWSKWRPTTPILNTVHTENIKIKTELSEVALDPEFSRELSSYLGKNDVATINCNVPSKFEIEECQEEEGRKEESEEGSPSDTISLGAVDKMASGKMRVPAVDSPFSSQSGAQNSASAGGTGTPSARADYKAEINQQSQQSIPSPFESRSVASSSMGTHRSAIEKSLSIGEFSEFTGASDASGSNAASHGTAAASEAAAGQGQSPSWAQSAADSISNLLGNFSMGPQHVSDINSSGPSIAGAGGILKDEASKEGIKVDPPHRVLQPREESASEAPGPALGMLPSGAVSGFGSWKAAPETPLSPQGSALTKEESKGNAKEEDSIEKMGTTTMPMSSVGQMSPANSKAALLQQTHLDEFLASARTPPKNR